MLPLDWAKANRDAIWAKAVEQYRAGEQWADCSEEERQAIAERNTNHREIDPWADEVAAYLERRQKAMDLPVTVPQVLAHLEVPQERQTNQLALRVRGMAESLQWVWDRRRVDSVTRRQGLWPTSGHPGHPSGHPSGHPK